MRRRYFEHIYNEICVAGQRRISRYALWLVIFELAGDPEILTRPEARLFVENDLDALLDEQGVSLDPRAKRRLEKSILRFDPSHPTPEEWITRLFELADQAA